MRLVGLCLTFAVLSAFILIYSRRPWWRTAPGRALMWTKVGAWVLIGSVLGARALDYPGEDILPTIGVFFYGGVNTILLFALLRVDTSRPDAAAHEKF